MHYMIDALHHNVASAWRLPTTVLREVYENTAEQSNLRRMVVQMYKFICAGALASTMSKNPQCYGQYPKRFLFDWIQSMLENRSQRNVTKEEYEKVDMCPLFHVHEAGIRCTKTGSKRSRDEMGK